MNKSLYVFKFLSSFRFVYNRQSNIFFFPIFLPQFQFTSFCNSSRTHSSFFTFVIISTVSTERKIFLNFKNVCLKLNYSIYTIRQNFIYLISIIINLSSSATAFTISGGNITISWSSSSLSQKQPLGSVLLKTCSPFPGCHVVKIDWSILEKKVILTGDCFSFPGHCTNDESSLRFTKIKVFCHKK